MPLIKEHSFQRWLLKYFRFGNGSLRPSVLSPCLTGTYWITEEVFQQIFWVSGKRKKKTHELMWFWGELYCLKIPLLVQFFLLFLFFFDRFGRFMQHLLTVWSCVCDLTFLFLPFGVQSLSLLPSALNSSVDSMLLTLIVILLSAFNIIPVRFPPCQSTDSVPQRTVWWSLRHVWILLVSLLFISWLRMPRYKTFNTKNGHNIIYHLCGSNRNITTI